VQRPSMVRAVKTPDAQSGMVLHRTRHLFVRQMTAVGNAIRAHLAEFGIVAPTGRMACSSSSRAINDAKDDRIPGLYAHAYSPWRFSSRRSNQADRDPRPPA